MIGAIFGDIIGSIYEYENIHSEDFDLFGSGCSYTDDSILTIATARAILDNTSYDSQYKDFGLRYPTPLGSYGSGFERWLYSSDHKPYNSFGNGSAMRVSPGFAFDDLDIVLSEAKKSAEITHSHPEGIKGAQATAQAIFMARKGSSKSEIRRAIQETYGYNMMRTCNDIRLMNILDEGRQL